jgi:prolyl 4-hydroxylase
MTKAVFLAAAICSLLAVVTPYGVDHSFPIHHAECKAHPSSSILENLMGGIAEEERNSLSWNVQTKYDEFMRGCREAYPGSGCDNTERDRVKMNKRQPASMQNYTESGFTKTKLDPALFSEILAFWSKYGSNEAKENWPKGNTYTNHWASPTYMVSLEDRKLRGGMELKKKIWANVKSELEDWTGMEVTPTSLYGIRVYKEDSMLAPHVDRMPLVTSAIIQVSQDVDEPWALEVYDHQGVAHNVTMEPGDLVLYESHSVIHGRPFPMVGKHYANIFVHFEPVGHSDRHEASEAAKKKAAAGMNGAEIEYKENRSKKITGHEGSNHDDEEEDEREGLEKLPIYIVKGSEEEMAWLKKHGTHKADSAATIKRQREEAKNNVGTGSTSLHSAAQHGDLEAAMSIIAENPEQINAKDVNGWQPLHEAARAGHVEVAEALIENGANIDERTSNGKGGTPLWWARESLGEDHPIVKMFSAMGAKDIGREL